MGTGWLTCIPAVLLPHSLCRFTTANAPANRQMPIASVVSGYSKKKEKTMYKILTFCTLLLITSCSGRQKESNKSISDNIVHKDTIAVNDTLRDQYHQYYFADKTPREFAELIMKDSVRPSDNFSTFRVMDSLNAKSLEDRKFYFKVFLNIMKKSDGALAEAVGSPAYDYVEKHTKEFFELSQAITKEQFELWANNVGVVIYLSIHDTSTTDAGEYYKKLLENCSPEQKSMVEKFYKIMKKAIVDCDNASN